MKESTAITFAVKRLAGALIRAGYQVESIRGRDEIHGGCAFGEYEVAASKLRSFYEASP